MVGNFGVGVLSGTVTFPSTGTWYDYLNGTARTVSNISQSFTLQPGEYHVFTSIDAALPVTLINFSGKSEGNSNLLSWQVANEINLDRYELEKSADGQNFSLIVKIKADSKKNYNYEDDNLNNASSTEYYRLKSVDKDGNFNYSAVVTIKTALNSWKAQVNPNPVSDRINLKIESPVQDKATVSITDISGRQLYRNAILIHPGNNSFEIYNDGDFTNGTYFISIFSTQKKQTIQFIRNK